MMNNHNHQNTNCSFAAEIVSYIYGEIGEKEKTVFETHLAQCPTCPEELADFMDIRFSVTEWKQTEFVPLAAPVIEIPFEKELKSGNIEPSPFFGLLDLRLIFSFFESRTTVTAAAFTALIVCVGLIFAITRFSGAPDIAGLENTNSVKPVISPTAEAFSNKNNEKPAVSDTQDFAKTPAPQKAAQNAVKVSDKTVKTKTPAQNSSVRTVINAANETNKTNIRKITTVRNQTVPKLNDLDEDEDDSLRLAELFEDIETLE